MTIQSIGDIAVHSIEECYRIADASENDAERSAINFAAYTMQMYRRFAKELAWACGERSAARRNTALAKVLMEMEANNESTRGFPSKREG